MIDKVLFVGQIFGLDILMDMRGLRPPEAENHIISRRSEWL